MKLQSSDTIKRPLLLAVTVVVIRLPTLWEPRWYSDEGTFTTVAWVHSLGRPLYSGVFDVNPPGIYWLYGALLRAGADQHHVVIQAALLLGVLASLLCLYWIAATWFGRNIALAAALLAAVGLSLPTLDGDLLNVEIAALPFFLAALVMALQKGNVSAVAAGVLAGCALLIRPSYLLDSVAIVIVLSVGFTSFRRILMALIGGVVVFGSAVIALLTTNSLIPYLTEATPLQRAYVIWSNGGSLLPLVLRLAVALLIGVVWYVRVRDKGWRPLALWLPASLAAASITPRELSHYTIEVIPPLAIAITAVLISTWRRLGRRSLFSRLAMGFLAVPVALGMLVTAAEAILILPAREVAVVQGTSSPPPFLHNFSYASVPAYYGRWMSWIVRDPFQSQDLNGFPGPFHEERAEAQLLDRLAAGSVPKIQVLGDRAWVYFLSRLPPATPYIALNSGFRLVPGARETLEAALIHQNADYVAVADVPAPEWLPVLESGHYEQVGRSPWPTYKGSSTTGQATTWIGAANAPGG